MSARSRAASWAQKRAIANPFHAEMPTSPPNVSEASRIRSTSASSPGTISAVPMATPAVDELAVQHLFTHRRTAEHHDFAEQERSVFGKFDVDAPDNPRPVEQDG